MLRRTLTHFSAFSLLTCIVMMWLWTQWNPGWGLRPRTTAHEWRIWGQLGKLHIDHVPLADWDKGKGRQVSLCYAPDRDDDHRFLLLHDAWTEGIAITTTKFAGVRFTRGLHGVNDSPWRYEPYWSVTTPLWIPVLLTAVAPLVWLARAIRRRRAVTNGLCAKCGYDLRATPERCPECGAIPRIAAGNEL